MELEKRNGKSKATSTHGKTVYKTIDKPLDLKAIRIPDISMGVMEIEIEGLSDLIVNAWSAKSIEQIKNKEEGKNVGTNGKRINLPRPHRLPEEEFQAARYTVDGKDYFPAVNLKKSMIHVLPMLKHISVFGTMTIKKIQSGVYFKGIDGDPNFVRIDHSRDEPIMRQDIVRVGKFPNKQPTLRYRPGYQKWRAIFLIEYMQHLVSAEQVVNLLDQGGSSGGLCEWRPEKNGSFGRFRIIHARPARIG